MTAPFGFYPAHSPCLMGTPKSQGNGVHAGSVRAGFWGPLGPAVPAGKTRRAAHKDVRRFRPGQEAPFENSRRDCAPAACGGRTAGGCFFCLLFFAQAKKVGPPRRAAPCLQARRTSRQAQKPEAAACLWSGPIPAQAMYFVAPLPNPSLPQGLPSVAAGRGASSWGR